MELAVRGEIPGADVAAARVPIVGARLALDDARFLYFMHAEDGRGKVLYLRFDGDYGLVEPR